MQIRKKWLNQLKNFFNKHFKEYYLASFFWWIPSSCENHCNLITTCRLRRIWGPPDNAQICSVIKQGNGYFFEVRVKQRCRDSSFSKHCKTLSISYVDWTIEAKSSCLGAKILARWPADRSIWRRTARAKVKFSACHDIKGMDNEKRGGLKKLLFDRSGFTLFTLRPKAAQRTMFLIFVNNNCFPTWH